MPRLHNHRLRTTSSVSSRKAITLTTTTNSTLQDIIHRRIMVFTRNFKRFILHRHRIMMFIRTYSISPHHTKNTITTMRTISFPQRPTRSYRHLHMITLNNYHHAPYRHHLSFNPTTTSNRRNHRTKTHRNMFSTLRQYRQLPRQQINPTRRIPTTMHLRRISHRTFTFTRFMRPLTFKISIIRLLHVTFINPRHIRIITQQRRIMAKIRQRRRRISRSNSHNLPHRNKIITTSTSVTRTPLQPRPRYRLRSQPIRCLPRIILNVSMISRTCVSMVHPRPHRRIIRYNLHLLQVTHTRVLPLFPRQTRIPLCSRPFTPPNRYHTSTTTRFKIQDMRIRRISPIFSYRIRIYPRLFLQPIRGSLTTRHRNTSTRSHTTRYPMLRTVSIPQINATTGPTL